MKSTKQIYKENNKKTNEQHLIYMNKHKNKKKYVKAKRNFYQDHDDKKAISLEEVHNKNKNKFNYYMNKIANLYFMLFNKNYPKVRYLFYILIIVGLVEYKIDSYIQVFPIKFSMFIIFLIPYIAITLDNEIFLQLHSVFELKFLLLFKIMILFNKNMNFYELISLCLASNFWDSIFIKKNYINQNYFSLSNKIDRTIYKKFIFDSHKIFLIIGYICNSVLLIYLLNNKKLTFHIFDNTFEHLFQKDTQIIYFLLFGYLCSRKFFKNFFKYYIKSPYNYLNKQQQKKIVDSKNEEQKEFLFIEITLYSAILSEIIFCCFFGGISFIKSIFYIMIVGIIIFLYENLGFLLNLNILAFSCIIYGIQCYIENNYNEEIAALINENIIYINISFYLMLVFIILVFFLEKMHIANYYIMLYQRIFLVKVIFDIWLIIKYVYTLYKHDPIQYFDNFVLSYKFILIAFIINYFILLLALLMKLKLYVKQSDVDYYFEDIVIYLKNKKEQDVLYLGGSAPYFEIKLYKSMSRIFSFLNEDLSKNNKKLESFNKIIYTVVICLFVMVSLLINDFVIYFPIFFVLLQLFSDILNDIVFFILDEYSHFAAFIVETIKSLKDKTTDKKIKYEDNLLRYYREKNKNKNKYKDYQIILKEEKLKMIYILAYFYIAIFWRLFFVKFFILLYENCISTIQFKLFGKLEPLANILYQFIISNYYADQNKDYNSLLEIISVIFFLLPNSLSVIDCHYYERKISFFFQNYILLSFFPLFFNLSFLQILLGLFNVLLMINLYSADEQTHKNFYFWYYLFGIQSVKFFY